MSHSHSGRSALDTLTLDRRQFLTLAGTGAAAIALFGCRGADAASNETFEIKLTAKSSGLSDGSVTVKAKAGQARAELQ